ncbi:hypothetical protein V6N13_109542 [Hibiscus sabdariffa]
MGANANQIQNWESLSLLIATNHVDFINEVVGLNVEPELFHVRVSELCPWIVRTRLLKTGDQPNMSTPSLESEESSSVKFESKNVSGVGDGMEVMESEDAFNALFVGKEDFFNKKQDEVNMANSLGEAELIGEEKSNDNNLEIDSLVAPKVFIEALEDVGAMGFGKEDILKESNLALDARLETKKAGEALPTKQVTWAEVDHQNKPFGDNFGPTFKKKQKRDAALKKSKAKSQEEQEMEIDSRSLSCCDLKVV